MNRLILTLALAALAFAASGAMDATFDDKNTVRSIRVGAAEFATGGGDLWMATFAQDGNLTNRVKVAAHDAASVEQRETDEGITLTWRDIPLGGERGVLDAKVAIEKRPDGSQAWRLSFDNRSQDWKLFSTDFPRLNRVTRNGEGDAMLPDCDHGARVSEALAGWQALELPGEYYQVLKPKGDDIFAILKAFGMELKQQLYTRGEIREMKATANPF